MARQSNCVATRASTNAVRTPEGAEQLPRAQGDAAARPNGKAAARPWRDPTDIRRTFRAPRKRFSNWPRLSPEAVRILRSGTDGSGSESYSGYATDGRAELEFGNHSTGGTARSKKIQPGANDNRGIASRKGARRIARRPAWREGSRFRLRQFRMRGQNFVDRTRLSQIMHLQCVQNGAPRHLVRLPFSELNRIAGGQP